MTIYEIAILAVLGAVFCAALLYGVFYDSIASKRQLARRIKNAGLSIESKAIKKARRQDEKQRRKLREESLKVVDQKRRSDRAATNPPLSIRLHQAGFHISAQTYYVICAGCGLALAAAGLAAGLPWFALPVMAILGGGGLPYFVVNFRRRRRFKKFLKAFPNAIDAIIRGVRSGLPLNDCIRIIAADSDEPLRGEFRKMVDGLQLGLSLPEVCERLYGNIAVPEVNFFAIVISIQSAAGGNLSEALSNLANVLRDRRRVGDKIKALSTEAKASAYVIGSLPFVISIMLSVISPGYMTPLFTTSSGNIVLYVCGSLMAVGILVMKKMINFKY